MIFPKGHIVKFEPTPAGRRRAAALADEFPMRAVQQLRAPHHVELIAAFIFHPAPAAPSRGSVLSPE